MSKPSPAPNPFEWRGPSTIKIQIKTNRKSLEKAATRVNPEAPLGIQGKPMIRKANI